MGDVGVDLGGFWASMSEEFLDVPEVGALFEEVSGEGVSEGMYGCGWVDAGGDFGVGEDMLDASDAVWAAVRAFEEVLDGLVDLEVFLQDVPEVWGEEGATVFSAFSVTDEEPVLLGLQVGESEVYGFADAETGGVDEHEDASVFEVLDGLEEGCDFVGL